MAPFTSLRARLGKSLFGQDDVKHASTEQKLGQQAQPTAKGGIDSTAPREAPAQDDVKAEEADAVEGLPTSTSAEITAQASSKPSVGKRISLQSILSTPLEDKIGQGGQSVRPGQRQSATYTKPVLVDEHAPATPMHSDAPAAAMAMPISTSSSSNRVRSGQSPSLSSSLKSLSERYTSNKEASETFKTMRERNDASPSSSGVSSRHARSSSDASQAGSIERNRSPSSYAAPTAGQATATPADSGVSSSSSHQIEQVHFPDTLIQGEAMLKVTSKKVKQRIVRIDADAGQILWDSKKNNCVNLEAIREVRTGADGRSYRTSLSIAGAHEERWLSVIYQANGIYKALHLIALSDESLIRWRATLTAVQKERKMLASCVDMLEQRQNLWLRQQFKGADASKDARLDFDEVARLCRRLGVLSNRADLRRRFDEADKDGDGYLDFGSFQHFVYLLKKRSDIEQLFSELADRAELIEGDEEALGITLDRFIKFLIVEQGLGDVPRAAIEDIFRKFCGQGRARMNADGLLSFLMSSDNAILSDQSSLAAARRNEAARGSYDAMSDDAAPAQESRAHAETAEELIAISGQMRVTQDMTRPLSEYYISSSHNTYLVGGQLTGESTVEGYIRALMHGARSVELDCWDGPNNEPVITHGRTLTSKMALRDVIQAIGRYAFVASPFPLILSLEVHNDLVQQNVVADILTSLLGDKLLHAPLPASEHAASTAALPSPQQLMGKILVKAKNLLLTKPKPSDEPAADRVEAIVSEKMVTTSTTDTTDTDNDGLLMNARDLVRSVTKRGSRRQDKGSEKAEKKVPMSPALAALLIYTIGVKHRGINKKETYAVEHMISLSERTALKYAKSAEGGPNQDDLIKHNRTHLTRIYPSMHSFARLSYSANFLPCVFWSMGCQLVALNWQTMDMGFEMNQAMFARNGRSGFVLKPDALRLKGAPAAGSRPPHVVLDVTVISAQQLPRSRAGDAQEKDDDDMRAINPFVSIAVVVPDTAHSFGVSARTAAGVGAGGMTAQRIPSSSSELTTKSDANARSKDAGPRMRTMTRLRTSTVRQNGFNPGWNETLSFQLRLPAAAAAAQVEGGDVDDAASVRQATRGMLDLCFVRFEARSETKRDSSVSSSSEDSIPKSAAAGVAQSSSSSSSSNDQQLHQAATSTASAPSFNTDMTSSSDADLNDDTPCLASYMLSLGAMEQGYRHVPLYDGSMTQHLFSTLFVRTSIRLAADEP